MPPGSGPGSLRGVPRKTIGRNARMRPSAAARFAALVTVTAAVDVLSNAVAMAVPRPRNTGIGRRSRLGMSDTLKALSDNDFRLLFRMERNDFNALLELVRDGLRTNHAMAILAAGQPIPADCRLALALRLLAGASYLDCMLAFWLGRCTVFDVFHQVCVSGYAVRWRGGDGARNVLCCIGMRVSFICGAYKLCCASSTLRQVSWRMF